MARDVGMLKKIGRTLIPLGAGVGAYFLVKDNKKMTTGAKMLTVGGTTLATFLIQRTVISFNQDSNVKKAPVDYGQIPKTSDGLVWNPDPLAQEFSRNFEGINLRTFPETTDKLNDLNNEQIKLLYNHYNEYYASDYPTLTQLIENEWTDWGDSYENAVARLKGLGLQEYRGY